MLRQSACAYRTGALSLVNKPEHGFNIRQYLVILKIAKVAGSAELCESSALCARNSVESLNNVSLLDSQLQ